MRHALYLLFLLPSVALAQAALHVIDGDTLEVGGERVHLYGLDAPEAEQQCEHYGTLWPCGAEARNVLERTIGKRHLDCQVQARGDDGAKLVDCSIGPISLNETMLTTGMAIALPDAPIHYAAAEEAARAARRGIWAGRFVTPAEWLQGKRLAPTPADERCRIKGDIGASGARRYYVPVHPNYAAVEIDAGRGERWFCSEIDAIDAGWELAE